MVHLITLNPAIDEYITLENFEYGKTNYRQNTRKVMGGKAVNVAMVLSNLNLHSKLITAVNKNDEFIINSLKKLDANLIEVDKTRVNLKIDDGIKITEINDQGRQLSNAARLHFEDYINQNVRANDIVLIAGNPHQKDIDFQFKLAHAAKALGAQLILDSNRFNLEMIKQLKPLLVKPNDEELEALYAGLEIEQKDADLAKYCDSVIISHGANGLTYIDNEQAIELAAIKDQVVNTVGAGDSLVAGYIYGLVNNFSIKERLTFAKYTASASVFNSELATIANIKKYDKANRFKL